MEEQLQHNPGRAHGADQVIMPSSEVESSVVEYPIMPDVMAQHQPKTPEQQSADSAPTHDTPVS